MLVTELGRVIDVKPVQPEKEYAPIIEDVKKAYVIVKEKVEARPVIREIIEK